MVGHDADLLPAKSPIQPLAGPVLDSVEDQQGTMSTTGLQLERVHQRRAYAVSLEILVNQKLEDLCPMWRIRFRRKIELDGSHHLTVMQRAEQKPLPAGHGANGASPVCLRLIGAKREHEPNERPVFDASDQDFCEPRYVLFCFGCRESFDREARIHG